MRPLVPRERNINYYNNKYNILNVRLTKVPIATPKLSPDGDHLGISPTVCLCSQAAEVIFDCAWAEFSQSKSATPKLSPDGDHLGISPTVCLCSQAAEVIFDCAWAEFSQSKSDERRFDLPARYGLPPSRFKGKR